MAGFWQPIEIGVCEETPGTPDQGSWHFRTVTIPATTPSEQRLDVATRRYLDRYDGAFVVRTWLQSVGKPTTLEDAEDIPTPESEYIQ